MTTANLERVFRERRASGRTALVCYLTIGDPSVEASVDAALAAVDAGADLLELGVPFSDPTADGPVIAAAAHRAIQRGGSLRSALRVASAVRARSPVPLVLFTYYNPVIAFGVSALPAAAAAAGIDGLLVVDLPPEEGEELRAAADAADLAVIPLIAPTTDRAREARVVARARGFLYYVSVTGVTGSGEAPLVAAGQAACALQERARLPVVVGFGITSAAKARAVAASGVDGVVVGTALVREIAGASSSAAREAAVRRLVGELRAGLDAR